MKYILIFLAAATLSAATPDSALKMLQDGNKRFVTGKTVHPNRSKEMLAELAKGQNPDVVLVACSDSRVAPEIIFDVGFNDLFVIRVAGNVVGNLEMESIKYAIKHLHSPLIMVMGHQNCGAVDAVLTNQDATIPEIADMIAPAIKGAKNLQSAIEDNVKFVVDHLEDRKFVSERLKKKDLKVVGAYFDFSTGKVELI